MRETSERGGEEWRSERERERERERVGGVRVDILMEGCCEFLRLVTLNSLGLILQLERRGVISNSLEVGCLFNEYNQIS